MDSNKLEETKMTRGGVTRHNFGVDDVVIMTGKKGESFGSSSELEDVQEYL